MLSSEDEKRVFSFWNLPPLPVHRPTVRTGFTQQKKQARFEIIKGI